MQPVKKLKPNPNDVGHFTVISITCFPGGRYMQTFSVDFTSRISAYETCDRLQDDLDKDGDPARVYVIEKGIPVRAGRMAYLRPNHFFGKPRPRAA